MNLAPGQQIIQRSTMILMQGSLIQKRTQVHVLHHHHHNHHHNEHTHRPSQGGSDLVNDDHFHQHSAAAVEEASAAGGPKLRPSSSFVMHHSAVLPVFKPPSLLLWLPDFLDLGLAHFFKHGESVV